MHARKIVFTSAMRSPRFANVCFVLQTVTANICETDRLFLNFETNTTVGETCNLNKPFECLSGDDCIPRKYFCDSISHCSDGSDEIHYNETIHQDMGMECFVRNSSTNEVRQCLLPYKYKCDHEMDCTLGEDECECNHTMTCDSSPASKIREKQCILRSRFCDSVRNCFDNTDENAYKTNSGGFQCPVTKARVTSRCALPQRYVCDGISDCDDGTDECFCTDSGSGVSTNAFINDHCFRCLDGLLVIPRRQLCDGKFHCIDLTDECLCEDKPKICDQICEVYEDCGPCTVGQLICQQENSNSKVTCIDRTQVCDGTYHCPLHEDESNCNIDPSNSFNCTDGSRYIPKSQHCDNVPDCEDKSDEMSCNETFFQCFSKYFLRNQHRLDFARPHYAKACDKVPTCEDLEDECNETLCGLPLPEYCKNVHGDDGYVCPHSEFSILGTDICDGFPTCSHYLNHTHYDEINCPGRFYCRGHEHESLPIHIPLSAKCNGVSDCHDHSDERNCSVETHFYCNSGFPVFLSTREACNGIQDCFNGEDECQNCSVSPISSDLFLVNSFVLQGIIWIVAASAVFGNLGVIYENALQFIYRQHTLAAITFCHRILVTNLAVADTLLGIYLVLLAITNELYRGIYCRKDIQWRSSTKCNIMGCVALISVMCSLLTLMIMATMRLFLTIKPFTTHFRRSYILIAIAFAWIISIAIAVTPLAESQIDYFVAEIRYQNNHFLKLVNRQDVEEFVTSLWSLQDNTNATNATFTSNLDRSLTWKNMIEAISRLNDTYEPDMYFGYYSAHGVCLPRIFPDKSSHRSWGFSLAIVTFIFVAFIYIFCVYITIYRMTTLYNNKQTGLARDDKTNKLLQGKITRIMFVSFCCWIPICVMAFIGVGGGELPKEAYAISAIVLLPINSAFDPIVYSSLPKIVWNRLCKGTKVGAWMEAKSQGIALAAIS